MYFSESYTQQMRDYLALLVSCVANYKLITCPFLTTGLSKTPCMPRIADWGGLMIGVPTIHSYLARILRDNTMVHK